MGRVKLPPLPTSPDGRYTIALPPGSSYNEERADHAVRFIRRYCCHIKGRWAGQPFVLEPWQEWQIVRPLFGVVNTTTGHRWYREALIGLPRKNGKSELAAAIALYLLVADGEFGPEVYSLAGDKKQASLVFGVAKSMVKISPRLRSACRAYRSVIEVEENDGLYRALSADADLQHGLNPHGAIVDEYHVHRNAEQYEAMRTGTAARDEALIVTITTAGEQEGVGPLWDLHKRGSSGTDPRMLFLWIGADDDSDPADPAVWKAANPASWIREEFLADQFTSLPLPVFERLHLNRWPRLSKNRWMAAATWAKGNAAPVFDPDRPTIVAVDAAPRRDKTAVVMDQVDEEGFHNVRCWTFDADPSVGFIDYSLVEALLRNLAADWNVTRMAFDPYGMQRTLTELEAEGLPVESYPQGHDRMVPASMNLHALAVDGLIRHGGDEALTHAVLNSAVREVAGGWRLAKVKGESNDAAVALAIATRIAEQERNLTVGPTVMVV